VSSLAVGVSERFGYSIFRRSENDPTAIVQAYEMAWRHEQWFYPAARSQDQPDLSSVSRKVFAGSTFLSGHTVAAVEMRLRASYRRQFECDASMRGQAEASRMSNSLAIDHHQLWNLLKPAKCRGHNRKFTKGEKTRHVRQSLPHAGMTLFDQIEIRKGKNAY
jgi:hypothetical protein